MLAVVLVGLKSKVNHNPTSFNSVRRGAYVGDAAVAAVCNLGLVSVDVDLGMSRRATAAITDDHAVMGPSHRLLVNQLNGSLWLRLFDPLALMSFFPWTPQSLKSCVPGR